MNFHLPFYEKKGTIKTITENERYYIVERYEADGKTTSVKMTKKTQKNFEALVENYYNDLKGYLDKYERKNKIYQESRLSKHNDKQTLKTSVLLSLMLIGLSIPLLQTYEALGYLGIVLDIIAIPFLINSTNLLLKEKEDEKKQNFMELYNDFSQKYYSYIKEKKKNDAKKLEKTQYKGISDNKREVKEKSHNKPKIKIHNPSNKK